MATKKPATKSERRVVALTKRYYDDTKKLGRPVHAVLCENYTFLYGSPYEIGRAIQGVLASHLNILAGATLAQAEMATQLSAKITSKYGKGLPVKKAKKA